MFFLKHIRLGRSRPDPDVHCERGFHRISPRTVLGHPGGTLRRVQERDQRSISVHRRKSRWKMGKVKNNPRLGQFKLDQSTSLSVHGRKSRLNMGKVKNNPRLGQVTLVYILIRPKEREKVVGQCAFSILIILFHKIAYLKLCQVRLGQVGLGEVR